MSFNFDADKIMKQVTDVAADHTYKVMQGAKRELGAEGHGITIRKSNHRSGDKLDLGNATFPSEEIKERFLKIVRRKLR